MCVALNDDVFFEEVGVVNKDSEAVSRPITADRIGSGTEMRPATQATSIAQPSLLTDTLMGEVVHLQILATWGSGDSVGMTGLELVQMDGSYVRASITSSVVEDEDVLR